MVFHKGSRTLIPYTKIYSIDHRSKSPKTIKLLEKNIRINLHDLGLATSFSDTIPKAQMLKEYNKL